MTSTPCLELDFTLIPVGGTWGMNGQVWTLIKRTDEALTFIRDGKRLRLNVFSKGWDAFVRDVEGLIVASAHGVPCGSLYGMAEHYRSQVAP